MHSTVCQKKTPQLYYLALAALVTAGRITSKIFKSPLPRVGLPQTEFTINTGFGIPIGLLDSTTRFAMLFFDPEPIYLLAERVAHLRFTKPSIFHELFPFFCTIPNFGA